MSTKTKFNIESIKQKNKQYLISKLTTGDLIKTKAEQYPLIYHYGIIDKTIDGLFILHNHPDKRNSNGGTIVKEPLDKWIKGKDIVFIEKTNLNTNDIEELYNKLKKYKYDFINFNCEHFVNFASDKKFVSNQVYKWGAIFLIGAFVTYLIRKNKI